MPEDPTPGGNPGAPAPTPAPAPAPGHDPASNPAFAAMRTENSTLKSELDQLKSQLTELQRKDMDDKQRMAAELEDAKKVAQELSPLKDQHAQIVAGFEKACTDAIAALPEDKRDTITALTQHAPLHERLAAIQKAAAVIGAVPVSSGTITQPGGDPKGGVPGGPDAAKPIDVKDLGKLSWDDALKAHSGGAAPLPNIEQMVESAVNKRLAAAGK